MNRFLLVLLLLVTLPATAATKFTLLATQFVATASSGSIGMVNDNDAPEGAWHIPLDVVSSCTVTVPLGRTLAPGPWSVYVKMLDYDIYNTNRFIMGGAVSAWQTMNDRDAVTLYWSTNNVFTTTENATTLAIEYPNRSAVRKAYLVAVTITDNTNEIILRDDLMIDYSYTSNYNAITNKGNLIPNGSFEAGVDSFWRTVVGGITNVVAELWDTNVSYHGMASLRIPNWVLVDGVPAGGQASLQSNPFLLSSNRAHSISGWVKTTNGTSYAWIYLRSIYTAPDGFASTYSSPNIGVTANTSWQRISTTLTNVPWYPSGEYYLDVITQPVSGGNYVFFDGLQVEEGNLTDFAPMEIFEYKPVPSHRTKVFWSDFNTNTVVLRGFNNANSNITRRVTYRILDAYNDEIQTGGVNISLTASNTALSDAITLPTNRLGHFRMEFSVTNSAAVNEMSYVMVPMPTAGVDEDAVIGAESSPVDYNVEGIKRGGIHWTRTLSTGQALGRWSRVEPTPGNFTWIDADVWTNRNVSILASLGVNRPNWNTNNAFFRLANKTGNFTYGEEVRSSGATGIVTWVMWPTNSMGIALQVSNLTSYVPFVVGQTITGQSSGATADVSTRVWTNVICFRSHTNFLRAFLQQYKGKLKDLEPWNEPDLSLSDPQGVISGGLITDADYIPKETTSPLDANYYAELVKQTIDMAALVDSNYRVFAGSGVDTVSDLTQIMTALGEYTNKANFYGWTYHHYRGNEGNLSSVSLNKPQWNSETGIADKGSLTGSRSSYRRAGKYAIEWKSGEALYRAFDNPEEGAINLFTDIGYNSGKWFYYDLGLRSIAANDFTSAQYTGIDYDGSYRIKAAWMFNMAHKLNGATGNGALTKTGTTAFLFVRGTTPLIAIWTTTNKTATLAGSVSTSDFRIIDMMGNATTPGSLAVPIGRMAVLLEGVGSVTVSNLAYAFTNSTVVERADTAAPKLAILDYPRIVPREYAVFRWGAIDMEGVPENVFPLNTTYSWNLNNTGWSEWNGDTFVIVKPTALTSFKVAARDLSGNAVTNTINYGSGISLHVNSMTVDTLNVNGP